MTISVTVTVTVTVTLLYSILLYYILLYRIVKKGELSLKLIANINEVTVEGWDVNSGEVKAKALTVELSEEFSSCANVVVTFSTEEGKTYYSKVQFGSCELPTFSQPQRIRIGVFGFKMYDGELVLRYSPRPTTKYVNAGSYLEGEESPVPSCGTIEELLTELDEVASLIGSVPQVSEVAITEGGEM